MGYRVLLTLFVLLAAGCGSREESGAMDLRDILGAGGSAGYARAVAVREFQFPRDHGGHPDFRNEWWYLTGHLRDERGRLFGYQATFFRFALAPKPPRRPSAWATNQVWMAHVALTDVAEAAHLADQRFARGALGLAGASGEHLRVWLGDWYLREEDGVWRLRVDAGAFALNLTLAPAKPVVLQGDRGLSRKGPEPGNASYYYSFTRVQTEGTLRRRGETHAVTGLSWLDREWGTGSLAAGQVGWDWFSLQLDSGADLMYYRLRDEEGTSHPASRGTWVTRDGRSRDIGPGNIGLEPLDWWRSADGRRYPVRWRLDYPEAGLDLIVRAVLPDQHMDLAVAYWEGLVEVVDSRSGRILGHGYLEMTGY